VTGNVHILDLQAGYLVVRFSPMASRSLPRTGTGGPETAVLARQASHLEALRHATSFTILPCSDAAGVPGSTSPMEPAHPHCLRGGPEGTFAELTRRPALPRQCAPSVSPQSLCSVCNDRSRTGFY
jgi:hypothetical protein